MAMKRVGICFDIDGVLLRGKKRLDGATESMTKLIDRNIPFVLLTNGGGVHKAKKALQVSNSLFPEASELSYQNNNGMKSKYHISADQMIVSHTPMSSIVVDKYKDKRVLVLGCRESSTSVANELGLNKVVTAQQLHNQIPSLYPFRTTATDPNDPSFKDPYKDEPIESIFIVHDPIDWHLELQLCLDLLRGWHPLSPKDKNQKQPLTIYNSNDDFQFSGEFKYPRLAQGSFVETLQHLWKLSTMNRKGSLHIGKFGKPHRVTFDFAEKVLFNNAVPVDGEKRTIFMVGDNPAADIRGANLAKINNKTKWISILVKTGMTTEKDVDDLLLHGDHYNKPDLIVNDVKEAVSIILAESKR